MKTCILTLCIFAVTVTAARTADKSSAPVRDLGVSSSYGVSAQIFDEVVQLADLENGVGPFLTTTLSNCQKHAEKTGRSAQSIANLRGNWLEYGMLLALKYHKLTPAYFQAEFKVVPNARNDVMVWSKEHGPIIISCKTSLRERYKQADLEAVALKAHYPDARFFLVTIDPDKQHVDRVRKKIADKEVVALQAIYDETDIGGLFDFLKTVTLTEFPSDAFKDGKVVR
jgi:hypothetical protein